MTSEQKEREAFYYDPDFRHTNTHPKDPTAPYCLRCQHNVDVTKAVEVTANEETWEALLGHNRHEEIRTNFNPQCKGLVINGYLGKDCYRKLRSA